MKIEKEIKYTIQISKTDLEVIRLALNFAIRQNIFIEKSEYVEKALDLHHLLFNELTNA